MSTSHIEFGQAPYVLDLLPRLQRCYGPEDPVVLVIVTFMNYLELSQGEALYLPADGFRVYHSGNVAERVARNDEQPRRRSCPVSMKILLMHL